MQVISKRVDDEKKIYLQYLPNKIIEVNEEEFIKICQIKRFYERWTADENFRNHISRESYQTIDQYNLNVDPIEVKPLWDIKFSEKYTEKSHVSSSVKLFQEIFIEGRIKAQLKHSLSCISDRRFKVWRERQIARAASQFHPHYHKAIVHAPMALELNKGCSVGCWFCGVSAPRLSDIFVYNQENQNLWREVLFLMKDILGTAANEGFCYWATDPLDNPDYEKFCTDFHEILGKFPPTTTALAWKDLTRTRSLLDLSIEKGCYSNRFSILSLKIFNQIHEEFSAEELATVGFALQNPESLSKKADAGKARERNKMKNKNSESFQDLSQGSIACVTGFLFNMVERSVKLISPCHADERWDKGYIIYDEGTFSDINELKVLLEKMITKHMPLSVRYDDILRFRDDLTYKSLSNGFQLSTKYLTYKFANQPYLKELGEFIQKGNKTTRELLNDFEVLGISQANLLYYLNLLFNKGIFNDIP